MPLPHLFFDLDGTLTHPHEGITRCIQHALTAAGVAAPPAQSLQRYVGPPLRTSFATLLGTADEVALDAAMTAYRERFTTVGLYENAVCPGVPAVLDHLRARGHRLQVVTAKPVVYARRVLEHFALHGFFEGVYGPELSSRGFSKQSLIRAALDATGAPASGTAMIGDRGEDVTGAHANGLHAIAVAWGYALDGELAQARPDTIVRSTDDLLTYLAPHAVV